MSEFVLIPGLNNTADIWAPAMALAPRVKWRAVNCPALETVEEVARALLEDLPDTFALAGYSFGGYVALAMMALAPHRIERVALVSTTTLPDTDKQRTGRVASIGRVQNGEHDALSQDQFKLLVDPEHLDDADLRERFLRIARAYGPERFVAHQRACMARPDRGDVLAAYGGPVLLVSATDDRVVPPDRQHAMRTQAKAPRIVDVAHAGHLLPLEQPAALSEALAAFAN